LALICFQNINAMNQLRFLGHRAALAIAISLITLLSAPAQQRYASLQEALTGGRNLVGRFGPASVNWINGGTQYSYSEGGGVIKATDPKTGQATTIFSPEGLKFPGQETAFAYQSFQWSADSRYLLFQTNFRPVWRFSGNSDYYFYSLADKTLKLAAKDARTAQLSPDGRKVGYERDGNLFVFDLATQQETQLTNDAADDFYNGRFGWAYEEEFALAQAWVWSPDGQYIAFWQSDERGVPLFQMTDYQGIHPHYDKLRYPKVGDAVPVVKVGVLNVTQKTRTWLDVPLDGGYLPRLYWTSAPGQVAVVHLNRAQTHLKLFFADAASGQARLVMEEKSEAWIDVYDFFAGMTHYFNFPAGVQEFYWLSDRSGYTHLYRYDYSGKLLGQVTTGNFDVVTVPLIDVKKKLAYYVATEASPLERHLYVTSLDGKTKRQLTAAAGRHLVDLAPNGLYFIDRYSNTQTPTQVELWGTNGKMLKKLEDNAAVRDYVAKQAYAPRELGSFTTTDGQKLDYYLVKPLDFDPNKQYPVVLNIYGGPGSQSVYNEFGRDAWEQWLAHQGYLVASVNNRGSSGYGKKFKTVVYQRLGEYESKDFVETMNHFKTFKFVDGANLAIRGHSYGGFMSSYTMLTHPGVFKVALVGAPVTDWRLYDCIYTERYMGLLPANEAQYKASASVSHAAKLNGHMLIAHSTMDENVHVQNTFQLVKALIDNGKDHDLRIYPPGAHGVAYSLASRLLLYTQYTDYLNKHLKKASQ
jgi:dipeptidyl-peptidase-4